MDRDTSVLKLIHKIDTGAISAGQASKVFDRIYADYEDADIIYDVADRYDQAYYDELLANARIGIYNRASLIRMAEIRYEGKEKSGMKLGIVIGGVVIVMVVAIVIIVIAGGRR